MQIQVRIEDEAFALAKWQNMHKLNREKEIIGFYLSAHPLDEYKFQYKFINGEFSKNFRFRDNKKDRNCSNDLSAKILDETDDDEKH